MKVHIYTTNVISCAIYTGEGEGGGCVFVLHAMTCLSYARENCVSYRRKSYFWRKSHEK